MLRGSPSESVPSATALERRDRATVLTYVTLLVVAAAAWIHVVWSAATMVDMGDMIMPMSPTVSEGAFFVGAWTVMMAAMMLPSASPMIALYAATQRSVHSPLARIAAVSAFTLVYVGLWAATGIPIYFARLALGAMAPGVRGYAIAAVFIVAGLFQLSPLKRVCLRNCRTPVGFLLGHWRPGWRGSLIMGWGHAAYCLGCCWALMVLLVAAGAMGLAWVLLISAMVAAEKLLPRGERLAWVIGVALVLLGLAVAARPPLAMMLRAAGQSISSSRGVAAIEVERLTRHEVGRRRGQIDRERSDLLGTTPTAGGNVPQETVGELVVAAFEGRGRHVGAEPARRDRVDLDVVARPLDTERAREGHDRALGR
jgi:predicted metal-binding membrane protein